MCSAAATAACAGTVWAIYGFGIGEVHGAKLCGMPLVSELWPRDAGPLPAPRWFEGLLAQLSHGYVQGHRNDLFGEISTGGWWWYYLAALAFKTTLGAQGLFVLRAGSLLLGRVSHWRIDVALLAFPLLLLLALSAARTQNGIMYLLPAYPCALLFLGRAFSDDNGVQPGWRRAVAWVLVGTCAVGALSQHPHHLMFFNYWAGGPEHGPALMSHRSDWGQDKRRLGEWQREHGVSVLNYVPFGNGRAVGAWGIRHRVPDCEPAPGVFALHAVHVYRPSEKRRGCFDWLTVEPPDERLGYSIYLYRVDESRIAALAGKRGHTTPFHRSAREHPR